MFWVAMDNIIGIVKEKSVNLRWGSSKIEEQMKHDFKFNTFSVSQEKIKKNMAPSFFTIRHQRDLLKSI